MGLLDKWTKPLDSSVDNAISDLKSAVNEILDAAIERVKKLRMVVKVEEEEK